MIPAAAIITLLNLAIGISGTFPISNKAAQWSIVVIFFIWYDFYSFLGSNEIRTLIYNMSLGVCALAQASEIASLPLRSQTQGLIGCTQSVSSWVVLFTIPYMINPDAGNLGGKVGYIFFGVGVIITLMLYLYCPETKGLSYDEVQTSFRIYD